MRLIRRILWQQSVNGPITTWRGKINGVLFFEIYQFKNDMFTDPFIMTSNIVPLEMKKSDDLEELQEMAQTLLEAFINSLDLNSY